MNAPLPKDEALRLKVLREYGVLDSAPEGAFDEVTALVADFVAAPISLISLVDEDRQWFKSHHGLQFVETPREYSFCAYAILNDGDVFEVPDTQKDPRFADNPLVTGEPGIRFYAGAPLRSSEGLFLGTLSVIDRVPRRLDATQRRLLQAMAKQVSAQLETRRVALALAQEAVYRQRSEAELRLRYEARLGAERQIRDELEAAQRFRQQITQLMPNVLYVFDCQLRQTVFVNHEVAAVLGYDAERFMSGTGGFGSGLMHPEDLPQVDDHLAAVQDLGEGGVAEFSYRMRHANGEWRWLHSRDAVLTRDSEGAVRQIVGTAADITAVKTASEAMRASEERFRTLTELSTVGIVATDDRGGILYLNSRAAEMLGLPKEECLGAGWSACLHPDDRQKIIDGWQQAVARRSRYSDEFRVQHADGSVISILGEAQPLPEDEPGSASYVGTMIDITAIKDLERHRLVRDAAVQANQAKSAFIARMSHELRTPLNGILGFSQLLQLGTTAVSSDQQREYARRIEQAGLHLLGLIDETLDLARIEAGVMSLQIEPVDLASSLEDCLMLVKGCPAQPEVRIHADLACLGSHRVFADRTRLKGILLNLLTNAVKYNRPGGQVTVTARTGAVQQVCVTISDTGIGLTPAQMERLFEPYNRLGAEATTVQGTGLGLVIARNLAELMQGSLTVESEPGVGSTFTLCLPMAA